MKRSRIRPVSLKRQRENRRHSEIREAVFARDVVCGLYLVRGVGDCFGPLTPHHRLLRVS